MTYSRNIRTPKYEWRKWYGSAPMPDDDMASGFIDLDIEVESLWVYESQTSPYGDTWATEEWYEISDSEPCRWKVEGESKTYEEVVEMIGEDAAQNVLEQVNRG